MLAGECPSSKLSHPAGTDAQLQRSLVRTSAWVDSGGSSGRRDHCRHPLQELQNMLKQGLLADPALCRAQIFQACIPILFFLFAFFVGITLTRHPKMRTRTIQLLGDPKNHMHELTYTFLIACVGVLLGLVFLRVMVGAVVKVGISICEVDLNEIRPAMKPDGDEQFELSQKNLIVGGLFT
ncbi:hypothetical protein BDZ94DRAFT_1255909 [Collybia nuda]|uniref:Uncharacterized protein n=1 Tax=Collybia nuda TaxID=64659 RepID=A0A9P5Y926_9AGAR|nr:hypothetical protein BDZ94DRAFT_1255909 [Collybia nuda]